MATKTTKLNQFIAPAANGTRGAHLTDVRTIVNQTTGAENFLLCFDDNSEVVMPGTWSIRASEFPNGLYEGQSLAAYWELDEKGQSRFHLHEVEL